MRYLAAILVVVWAAALAGCPRPVGACRYAEEAAERGTVRITSVEEQVTGIGAQVIVHVEGLFERPLSYPRDEYLRCVAGAGHGEGSEVPAAIMPGGPCPPQMTILDCRPWQS